MINRPCAIAIDIGIVREASCLRNTSFFRMPSPFQALTCAVSAKVRRTLFEHTKEDGSTSRLYAWGQEGVLPHRSFLDEQLFHLASQYICSPESTVTALNPRLLSGLLGALLARQSRIPGTTVDVLVKEFLVTTPEEAAVHETVIGGLKTKKLDEIIERILIQYGDDSVQELEYATVLFNSVSNLATKVIEDRRLGGFIEQSSRYVLYTQRDPITNHWMYLREPTIMASSHASEYIAVLDRCFELYAELAEALTTYYSSLKPKAEAAYAIRPGDPTLLKLADLTDPKEIKEFERVYTFDLRTRACDTARCVLPAATLTNVAMVANGRTFEHLLKRLYSSSLWEMKDIGTRLHDTLNTVIPKYVKRAHPDGEAYTMGCDARTRGQLEQHFPEFLRANQMPSDVTLIDTPNLLGPGKAPLAHLLSALYFPFARASFSDMVARLNQESEEHLRSLLTESVGTRKSRRDRSPRAFEMGYPCTFEVVTNFGAFRDLHRHRMLTQQRQYLHPHLGFDLPKDIEEIGFGEKVMDVVSEVAVLWEKLHAELGAECAQYVMLFGHRIRFIMGFNLREAQHLLELRTIPQGHPDYRFICQRMAALLRDRAPYLAPSGLLTHVDEASYPWARAAAEARQSQKRLEKGVEGEE